MIPLLTAQAVEKKCSFEHVILLGNYELCYSLGVIAKAAGLEKEKEFSNVGELKAKVLKQAEGYAPKEVAKPWFNSFLMVSKELDAINAAEMARRPRSCWVATSAK